MNKNRSASKIKLNSFDELFGSQDISPAEGKVQEISLDELYSFKNHPFRVSDDEKMNETVESIKNYGVLSPGIARPRAEGGYEIISGHRRKLACEILGLKTMPVIVRDYDDDEAIVIMVDSNIQREDILPSEKARAYAMKYEAIKHQGKAGEGNSLETVGKTSGENSKTVQRYIRLSRLNDDLLYMIDVKRVGFSQGVELSYLSAQEQLWVQQVLESGNYKISVKQAAKIKEYSRKGELSSDAVKHILGEEKKPDKKIAIERDRISGYFSEEYSDEEIQNIICELLENWHISRIKEAQHEF